MYIFWISRTKAAKFRVMLEDCDTGVVSHHHLQSFAPPPMTSQELKLPMNTRCSFVFEFKVNSTEMDQLLRRFCVTWS